MAELFLELVKMSLIGALFAVAVMAVRLVFRKAPKWIFVVLWGVVALRLILPFSLESKVSLVPDSIASGEVITEVRDAYVGQTDVIYEQDPVYQDALASGGQPVHSEQGNYIVTQKDSVESPKTFGETVLPVLGWVWLAGVAGMLVYTAGSYLLLKRKMAVATLLRDNIWQCEAADMPFVLGVFRPRIYLPYWLQGTDFDHVIAHEQAHIARKDHWWKPLGFLLLSLHWFNPVIWVAYILLCRDIEAACDEKVIDPMDKEGIRAYSTALLNCSVHRRRIAACPLAFGETGVKERIRRVMNYKKPTFWIILIAVIACAVAAVCFLTNPFSKLPNPQSQTYKVGEVVYKGGVYIGVTEEENPPFYIIDENMHLASVGEVNPKDGWTDLGQLEEMKLPKNFLDLWLGADEKWQGTESPASLWKNNAKAWRLLSDENMLYYVLQQKNGDLYLARKENDLTSLHWIIKLAPAQQHTLAQLVKSRPCDRIELSYCAGEAITITNEAVCSDLLAMLSKVEGTRGESSKGHYGVIYSLDLYQQGKEEPLRISLWDKTRYDTTAHKDGEGYAFFYRADLSELYGYLEEHYPTSFWYPEEKGQLYQKEGTTYYLNLPISGEKLPVWDYYEKYLRVIDFEMLKTAEAKLRGLMAENGEESVMYLREDEGKLYLYVEMIVETESKVAGQGFDHEHLFFSELITNGPADENYVPENNTTGNMEENKDPTPWWEQYKTVVSWPERQYVLVDDSRTVTYKSLLEKEVTIPVSIPKLIPFSLDAVQCQAEIESDLEYVLNAIEFSATHKSSPGTLYIRFEAYLNGDVLSILLYSESGVGSLSYHTYNFDVTTGKRLDTDALMKKIGFDNYTEKMTQAAKAAFENHWGTSGTTDLYIDRLNATIDPQNIAKANPYLDQDGNLKMTVFIGSMAGASGYEEIVSLALTNDRIALDGKCVFLNHRIGLDDSKLPKVLDYETYGTIEGYIATVGHEVYPESFFEDHSVILIELDHASLPCFYELSNLTYENGMLTCSFDVPYFKDMLVLGMSRNAYCMIAVDTVLPPDTRIEVKINSLEVDEETYFQKIQQFEENYI